MAARGNIQVTYPSTPAQYFHLLRRQVKQADRKPLVVMTPKSLLRHPEAVSGVADLAESTFLTVIDDPGIAEADVRRIALCSGKVFYDLLAYRREHKICDVALLRVEQLYPYPGRAVADLLTRYRQALDVVWVQEEPRNMGAWDFVGERLRGSLAPNQTLRYVGRPRSASTATGSYKRHVVEQGKLIAEALVVGDAARHRPVVTGGSERTG
jgi:2-oxoglutarate dehydrogenase E1 component